MGKASYTLKQASRTVADLDWWVSWGKILAGCVILAAGFVFFINPYNIVPGGVYCASQPVSFYSGRYVWLSV